MKPRNGLADQVRRSARRLAGEGRIARNVMSAPISAFELAPGDFPIARVDAEGTPRTVEQALDVARRRDPGATYKRATARWYVFSGGRGAVTSVRFTAADVERAHEEWGCNCGPAALAAICGLTLEEVRSLMGDSERKRYTNPTLMFESLRRTSRTWHQIRRRGPEILSWPRYGLARIQWEGPWTQPGVPMAARYRQTHWVGAWTTTERGVGVWDINAISNGSGWCSLDGWTRVVVPWLTGEIKRATGGWHITHAIEVAP